VAKTPAPEVAAVAATEPPVAAVVETAPVAVSAPPLPVEPPVTNAEATDTGALDAAPKPGEKADRDSAKRQMLRAQAALKARDEARDALAQAERANAGLPDYAATVTQYRKAADRGDTEARYNLGLLYELGNGVPQSYEIAAVWYREAASKGSLKAALKLGMLYDAGRGVAQSDKLAIAQYREVIKSGNDNAPERAEASKVLGDKYYQGKGVDRDYETAMEFYTKAAGHANADAMNSLGAMYHLGQGLKAKDYALATEWYSKAAEQAKLDAKTAQEAKLALESKAGYQSRLGAVAETTPAQESASAAPAQAESKASIPPTQETFKYGMTLPVKTLYVEMDAEDAEMLNKKPPHDKSSFATSVVENGVVHHGRIEVKGSSTRRFAKKSVLIKLDNNKTWEGYTRISLNSMATDASMMRDWLSMELARVMGLVVPNTNYTRLYINNKYAGLYLFTQWVDGKMFARSGLGADGDLIQPVDASFCGDLQMSSLDESKNCYAKFSPDDGNLNSLYDLIKEIDAAKTENFNEFMDKAFDSDSVINWIVLNGLVADGDTYNKNYFLYHSKVNNKWLVSPWDYDLTFGRNWDAYIPFPENTYNDNFQYYNSFDNGAFNPIKNKLLNNRVLLKRFRDKLRHMLGIGEPLKDVPGYGWFNPERMERRIDAIKAVIQEDAKNDPLSADRIKAFEDQVESLKYYSLARYAYLKNGIAADGDYFYTFDPNWIAPDVKPIEMSATSTLPQGKKQLVLLDKSYSQVMAVLNAREQPVPVKVTAIVDGYQVPNMLPPGKTGEECLQRGWSLMQSTPRVQLITDVTLEYHQENGKFQEVGKLKEADIANLELWALDGGNWSALPTSVNYHAKTLTTRNLTLNPDQTKHFVACVVPADQRLFVSANDGAKPAPTAPVAEAAAPAATTEVIAAPAPAAVVEVKPVPAAVTPAPAPVAASDAEKAQEQAKADAQAQAKAAAEAKAQAQADAKAKAQEEAKAEAKAKAQEEAKAQAQAKAEAKAKAQEEAKAQAQAKAEAKAKALEEAKAKAQAKAEAKAKAQEEAKAQAQAKAEAKAKAQEEAKAQAQAKAEAKAKAKEEAKAKAQADADAKAQAAEQAKAANSAAAPAPAPTPAPAAEIAPAELAPGVAQAAPQVAPVYLQLGAFKSQREADSYMASVREKLADLNKPISSYKRARSASVRVDIGPYSNEAEAHAAVVELKSRLGSTPELSYH